MYTTKGLWYLRTFYIQYLQKWYIISGHNRHTSTDLAKCSFKVKNHSIQYCAKYKYRFFCFVFLKMGQSWPLFCLFSFFSCYNFNSNWKNCRWCAWDSNPGPQDGRRRLNHRAMAATLVIWNVTRFTYKTVYFWLFIYLAWSVQSEFSRLLWMVEV